MLYNSTQRHEMHSQVYTGPIVPKPDVASTNYAKEPVRVGQKCVECNEAKVHEHVRKHVCLRTCLHTCPHQLCLRAYLFTRQSKHLQMSTSMSMRMATGGAL